MVAAIIVGRWLLPESRSERPGRVDVTGVLLSVGGMVAVVYGVKHLAMDGPDPQTLTLLVVGAAALAAFVRRCSHQDEPMLAVRLFVSPVFRAGVLTALVSSTVLLALL